MRRYAFILLPMVFGFVLVTTAVLAQATQRQTQQPNQPIPMPAQMVVQAGQETLTLEPYDPAAQPQAPDASPASDSCATAPLLFDGRTNDGSTTTVNNMTTDPNDPSLQSCMWGVPSSNQGYRTAWYKFTAPRNGVVVINTYDSTYDTVLAVYENVEAVANACADPQQNLVQVTCNDDQRAFESQVRFAVRRGQQYYVEVADWQAGVSGPGLMRLSAIIEPIDSQWTIIGTPENMPGSLTRHAVASDGARYLYVVGGQTTLSDTPVVSRRLMRLDTFTGQWTERQPMPGAAGLSNTTAVYVNGKIYVPGGYNGNNQLFDSTHWVYNIASNAWSDGIPSLGDAGSPPLPLGVPFAWGTAVAQNNDRYHLLGGLASSTHPTSTERILDTFYTYSTITNQWQAQSSMLSPRFAHTAALVGGRVCVVGGLTGDTEALALLSNGECWSSSSGWQAINSMNIPRYMAGSAVGPDGLWYVFGGLDGSGQEVSVTEVYDPATNQWSELGVSYDLGGGDNLPARAWPRGGFIGRALWVIGGDFFDFQSGVQALNLVERARLFFPGEKANLPIMRHDWRINDDTFGGAIQLNLNQPRQPIFDGRTDYFDTFYFDLTTPRSVWVQLRNIPSSSDYNLYVYDANKTLWGESRNINPADGENVRLNSLAPGRYYVVIERTFPINQAETKHYWVNVQS